MPYEFLATSAMADAFPLTRSSKELLPINWLPRLLPPLEMRFIPSEYSVSRSVFRFSLVKLPDMLPNEFNTEFQFMFPIWARSKIAFASGHISRNAISRKDKRLLVTTDSNCIQRFLVSSQALNRYVPL